MPPIAVTIGEAAIMTHLLPDLLYDPATLEPAISGEIIELH